MSKRTEGNREKGRTAGGQARDRERDLDHVHTKPAKLVNASFSLRFDPPTRLT